MYLCVLCGSGEKQRLFPIQYWLVFITETESVYCSVRTGRLHVIPVNIRLKKFRRNSDGQTIILPADLQITSFCAARCQCPLRTNRNLSDVPYWWPLRPITHNMLRPCCAHAAPMPFPCHAVPLSVYNVSFPFDLHSAAVSDSHLPFHAHAMLWPYLSSQDHGTAWPSRDGLWATCPRSASSGYHAEFHEGCYQTHTNLRCRWPVLNKTPFIMDEEKIGSSTLQKTICYTVGLAVRIFPTTMRTFTKDTALSEQGRGAVWHVWINARHGRGTACNVRISLYNVFLPCPSTYYTCCQRNPRFSLLKKNARPIPQIAYLSRPLSSTFFSFI